MYVILVAVIFFVLFVLLVKGYARYGSRILWTLFTLSPRQIYIRTLLGWNKFLRSLSFKNVGECHVKMIPGAPHEAVKCKRAVKNTRICEHHQVLKGQTCYKYHMVGQYSEGSDMYAIAAVAELDQRFKYRESYDIKPDHGHAKWEAKLQEVSRNYCIRNGYIITVAENEARIELEALERERANDEALEREQLRRYEEEEEAWARENQQVVEVVDEENWCEETWDNEVPEVKELCREDHVIVFMENECLWKTSVTV